MQGGRVVEFVDLADYLVKLYPVRFHFFFNEELLLQLFDFIFYILCLFIQLLLRKLVLIVVSHYGLDLHFRLEYLKLVHIDIVKNFFSQLIVCFCV